MISTISLPPVQKLFLTRGSLLTKNPISNYTVCMQAFWWFKENSVAGMGRPGFNKLSWGKLGYAEDLALGWFGARSSGVEPIESLQKHMHIHGAKLMTLLKYTQKDLDEILNNIHSDDYIKSLITRVTERTECLETFEIADNHIYFTLNSKRLNYEVDFLQKKQITKIIALTETHHENRAIEKFFQTEHIPIDDLGAPKMEQVTRLAELIDQAQTQNHKIAVHCMAGIGRTSTMLMAAHIVRGEKLTDLNVLIAKQNPAFKLTQIQLDFLKSI